MATKRLNFEKIDDNKWIISQNSKTLIKTEGQLKLFINNWIILIRNTDIWLESKSKAKKGGKKKFRLELQDGSLFLYNSTTNWYWYFRPKKLQNILDKFLIDRIISLEELTTKIKFYGLYDDGNLKILDNYDLIETPKYYSPSKVIEELNGEIIIDVDKNYEELKGKKIYIGDLTLNFKDWILVENRKGHRDLYIDKKLNLETIDFDNYDIILNYAWNMKGE